MWGTGELSFECGPGGCGRASETMGSEEYSNPLAPSLGTLHLPSQLEGSASPSAPLSVSTLDRADVIRLIRNLVDADGRGFPSHRGDSPGPSCQR